MKLKELDKDYRAISNGTYTERIEYCEKLIEQMKGRLTDNFKDTNHMRALILEMIEAAEKEIVSLKYDMNKKK
jgi:hypothetical protein